MAERALHDGSARSDVGASAASQKRNRNRLAQQAFRRRQNTYIKELERQIADHNGSSDDHILQLEQDNRMLRSQLTATINKLNSVQSTLKSLSDTLDHLVQGSSNDGFSAVTHDGPPPSTSEETSESNVIDVSHTDISFPVLDLQSTVTTEIGYDYTPADWVLNDATVPPGDSTSGNKEPVGHLEEEILPICYQEGIEVPTREEQLSIPTETEPSLTSLPGVWSHHYQMGPPAYLSRLSNSDASMSSHPNSNSPFSDHMYLLRHAVLNKWRALNAVQAPGSGVDSLRLCVTITLSLFNSLSRPVALAWYTATNYSRNIADITLWQMSRSRDVYLRLHVNYRPTGLQLTETYPSIIDWCPFPTIRDRLVLLHAANPFLDSIICDIATSYVVEVDAADLVHHATGRRYIRVWDLICAMGKPSTSTHDRDSASSPETNALNPTHTLGNIPASHLPAPTVEQLFTRQYARLAFKSLALDDGIPRFKLDPCIFVKYPELYDSGADIIAGGTPIIPGLQTSIPPPVPPAAETMHIYRHFADWSFSAFCRGLKST